MDKDGGAIAPPGQPLRRRGVPGRRRGPRFHLQLGHRLRLRGGRPARGPIHLATPERGGLGERKRLGDAALRRLRGHNPTASPTASSPRTSPRALLLDPRRCAAEEPCPRTYSLRDSATGALTSLPAEAAGMRVLEASPDLGLILFEDEAGGVWAWSGGTARGTPRAAGTSPAQTGQRRRAAPGLPLRGGNPALRQHRREHGRTGHRALPGRPAARRRPLAAPLRLLQPERRTPRRLGLDPRRAPERHHRHL